MKRLLCALFVILFLNMSCDSGDDSGAAPQTFTIIGTWNISQRTVDEVEEALGECEPVNTYTYNANGSYSEIIYAADQGSTSCLNNPSVEFTGTWTKNFDNSYKFTNSENVVTTRNIIFVNINEFYYEFNVLNSTTDPTIATIRETYIKI